MFERKRNLDNLTPEQFEAVQDKLSLKLSEILEKAKLDANTLLNQYGINVDVAYKLKENKNKPKKTQKT